MNKSILNYKLIAPCGMNCGICRAYLRLKNPCHGCNYAEQNRPKTREHCQLRICSKRKGRFCFKCKEYPCERLSYLDKRYRTKYGMSEIENLEYIRKHGIKKFIEAQRKRWVSDKGVLCVHDRKIYKSSP
jgi:hypothetical protein